MHSLRVLPARRPIRLALRVVRRLGEVYHPDWVRDLRARCFAYLGNARRVLGELRGAYDAFRKANDCLTRGGIR